MVVNIKGNQYKSFVHYLSSEQPEFYTKFRKHFHEKKSVASELTEEQYLIWVSEEMNKQSKTKLQKLDELVISEEEIKKLEEILTNSPQLESSMRKYADLKEISPLITNKDKGKLEKKVASEVYEGMGSQDKKQYTKGSLTVLLRRLNLGPWIQHSGNYPAEDVSSFISTHQTLFEGNEEIAVRLYERHLEQEVQKQPNHEKARDLLEGLKTRK